MWSLLSRGFCCHVVFIAIWSLLSHGLYGHVVFIVTWSLLKCIETLYSGQNVDLDQAIFFRTNGLPNMIKLNTLLLVHIV